MIEDGTPIKFVFTTMEKYHQKLKELRASRHVLYIHGYKSSGSTGESLKKLLSDVTTVHTIPVNENPDTAIIDIDRYLGEHPEIYLVVGSSLGAFITSQIDYKKKLLINLCLYPSIELPKIGCSEDISSLYKTYEFTGPVEPENTYLLFGTEDELFSYKEECKEIFEEENIKDMPGVHHHLTEEELKKFVVPEIISIITL